MTTSASTGPRRPMTARKQKVIILTCASVACAIPGLIALAIESATLGYVSVGVLVAGILAGPVVDRMRGTGE